jgi:hypothetical protein
MIAPTLWMFCSLSAVALLAWLPLIGSSAAAADSNGLANRRISSILTDEQTEGSCIRSDFTTAGRAILLSLHESVNCSHSEGGADRLGSPHSGNHQPQDPSVFQLRGFSYSNYRIGEGPSAITDGPFGFDSLSRVDICQQDIPLMRRLNVNAIKIYDFNVIAENIDAQHKECLDLLWNNGHQPIFAILSIWISNLPFSSHSLRQNVTDSYRRMVATTADHPAVLGYSIGSEIGGDPNDNPSYWQDFNVVAKAVKKALNGRRKIVTTGTYQADCTSCTPVVPCIGHIINGEKYGAVVDVWGVDVYFPNPQDETLRANIFNATTKPFFFPEYGVNYQPPMNLSEQTLLLYSQIQGVIQYSYTNDTIQENNGNASVTPFNASGPVYSGGLVFEWIDEYWKGGPLCQPNPASAQPYYGANMVALKDGCTCPANGGSFAGNCSTNERTPRPILADPTMLPSLWPAYTPHSSP